MFLFSDTGEATLRIMSVASEDDGVYTCVATNELGSTASSASLRVLGKATLMSATARPPKAGGHLLCLVPLQLCLPTASESAGRTTSSVTTQRWWNWAGRFVSTAMATTKSKSLAQRVESPGLFFSTGVVFPSSSVTISEAPSGRWQSNS